MGDHDDSMNEDSWLYGDGDGVAPPGTNGEIPRLEMDEPKGSPEPPPPAEEPPDHLPGPQKDEAPSGDTELPRPPGEEDLPPAPGTIEPAPPGEHSPKEGDEEGEEDDDDEDSDDDIRVTIGNIKTAPPQYPNLNKMRGAVLSSGVDKISKSGKFSIEEFESIGSINGLPAHEFSIDALEEKPWRKPGADITDYFNYGFNEDTWRAYCERQKTLRIHESGVGLGGLGVPRNPVPISVMNDGAKYGGGGMPPSMGVPPPMIPSAVVPARKTAPIVMTGGRRSTSVIDVIGGGIASRRTTDSPPKENVIQVMSSERRDFRKSFDMTVPPPGFDAPPPGVAPPVMPRSALPHHNRSYPPHGGYGGDYYGDVDYYSGNFEPTQEMQSWGSEVRNSRHRDRRSARGSSNSPHKRSDRHARGGSTSKDELPGGITIKQEPIDKGYKESRERDRDRSERHKERSHRHRTRSRSPDRERRSSRKHKSRSRSPGHRSHKKKKSKKSDKRDTGSD